MPTYIHSLRNFSIAFNLFSALLLIYTHPSPLFPPHSPPPPPSLLPFFPHFPPSLPLQLAAYGTDNSSSFSPGFPVIRWAQTANYGFVPNPRQKRVFMAVAMDLGDPDSPYGSIHPRDKQDVAARLALAGRAIAYDDPLVYYTGPIAVEATLMCVCKLVQYFVGNLFSLPFLHSSPPSLPLPSAPPRWWQWSSPVWLAPASSCATAMGLRLAAPTPRPLSGFLPQPCKRPVIQLWWASQSALQP